MKKGAKKLILILFIIGIILILSFSFVSASLLSDIGNFFKKVLDSSENKISGEQAELGTEGVIDAANSLVAYFAFDGNFNDISGNNNHGKCYNTYPLYRLVKSPEGRRLYTQDEQEKNNAISQYGYTLEGITGYIYSENDRPADTYPLYRLHSTRTWHFLYTISEEEKTNAIAQYNFVLDGTVGYVHANAAPGTIALYKLVKTSEGKRFYTTSLEEKNNAISQYEFSDDGIAGYIFNNPLCPIIVSGKLNQAYNFDGINDYIEVADSNSISLTNAITMSAWINEGGVNTDEVIISKDNEYLMKINPSNEASTVSCFVYVNNNWEPRVTGATIPANLWTHVACTYNKQNGNLQIFINGALYATTTGRTGNIIDTTNPLNIGRRRAYFKGGIDEVKIWNYVLTDSEILSEYNRGSGCTPNCINKQCGNDGCSGACGTCPTGKTCNIQGRCVSTCTPNCINKQCGNDGCSGACGTCPTGKTCNIQGRCVSTCTPNCINKQCGNDGCSGACGTCPTGKTCNENNQCTFINRILSLYYPFEGNYQDSSIFGNHGVCLAPFSLYRFYEGFSGTRIYTTDENLKNYYLSRAEYVYEGVTGYIGTKYYVSGTFPLYKLYHYSNDQYFYTADEQEKNNAIQNFGYEEQGIEGYVFKTQASRTVPLYRLHHSSTGQFLYTISETEKNNAVSLYRYIYDGITAYIYPDNFCPETVNGKVGKAKSFNGIGDYLIINPSADLNLGNEITISSWIKTTSSSFAGIIKRGKDGTSAWNQQEYAIRINNGYVDVVFANGVTGNIATGSKINDGKWHHVTGVLRNDATIEIYVDGLLIKSEAKTFDRTNLASTIFLGTLSSQGNFFNGIIDEVKIWNYALSGNEILQQYILGNRGLSSYHSFDGNTNDYSSNNNPAKCADDNIFPFYRLVHNTIGTRLYTINDFEKNNAISRYGFNYEGIAGYILGPNNPSTGTVPLYRLHHYLTYQMLYTVSVEEKNNAISRYGYVFDGVSGYAYATQVSRTVPLYKLHHYSSGQWLYTVSETEKNNAVSQYGYIYDGITAYIYPDKYCPEFAQGKSGKAYNFDGINDYLEVLDSNNFDFNSFTVGAWIKTGNAGTGRRKIIGQQDSSSYWSLSLNDNRLEFGSSKDGVLSARGNNLNDNNWHYINIVRDAGNKLYWYVDGNKIYEQAITNSEAYLINGNVQVGRIPYSSAGAEYFKGMIDELKVWSYALNENEIKTEYQAIRSSNINFNLQMSVSTLKDFYRVSEQIKLTDPPETMNDFFISNISSLSSIVTEIEETNIFRNFSNKTYGYIVQFEDEPLSVKYAELKEIVKDNKEKIDSMSDFNPVKYGYNIFKIKEEDIPKKLESYDKDLKSQSESIKEKIKNKLGKEKIVTMTGNAIFDENELVVVSEYKNVLNGISLRISPEEAEKIKDIPGIKSVNLDLEVNAMLKDSVPLIRADQVWTLDKDGNQCSVSGKECLTGKGVTIAIIDSGIDYTHPDLGGCFGANCKVIGGWDYVNSDPDPMDDMGHGTHCAGITSGTGAGGLKGIAPDSKLYAFKVLDSEGRGSDTSIISAINWAMDPNLDGNFEDHVDIISLSLGTDCMNDFGAYNWDCGPDDPVSNALKNAINVGVIVVVAAGNSGPDAKTINSPGVSKNVITVGATYSKDIEKFYYDKNPKKDQIAWFSSRGPVEWLGESINKPDILAPGALICSSRYDTIYPYTSDPYFKPCIDEKHVLMAGTSMATPMVAGAIALLKQKYPDLSNNQAKQLLQSSAINLGYDGNTQGAGRIDVKEAVNFRNRIQSKLVNNENFPVFGRLSLVLQKKSGNNWENIIVVYDGYITVPANGLIKLDLGKDNLGNQIYPGWNNMNVQASSTGEYKIYSRFIVDGKSIVNDYLFNVI